MAESNALLALTDEQIRELCDIAVSCGDADMQIAGKYDIEGEELEDLLLDNNIERCTNCQWWCHSYELLDEEGEPVYLCSDCQDD